MPDKKRTAWVLNGILADRAGVKVRCVQYALTRLVDCEWFSCEKADNAGKRRITRSWRYPGERAAPKCTLAMHENARSGVHENARKKEQGSQNKESNSSPGVCPSTDPAAPVEITLFAPSVTAVPVGRAGDTQTPVRTAGATEGRDRIARAVKALATGGRKRGINLAVERTARLLTEANLDEHSFENYCKALWDVVNGERAPEVIMAAFDATQDGDEEHVVVNLGGNFFGALANMEMDAAAAEVESDVRSGKGAEHCATPLPRYYEDVS